jgi:hypothetical protein
VAEPRHPGSIPDDEPAGIDVTSGLDTDGDGRGDTTVVDDGFDLVLSTDLDGDGLADQVLRIGTDALVRESSPTEEPWDDPHH